MAGRPARRQPLVPPAPARDTERQVNQGLAGLFLIGDGTNPDLPHRYGIDDVPVIVRDRRFDAEGAST